jgi:HEAT repeat protein
LLTPPGPPEAPAAPDADEVLLRRGGGGTDTAALLTLLHNFNPPAADPGRLDALARLLGDERFERREQASRELIDLGRAALPRLRALLDDPDAEVRRRAADVLAQIQSRHDPAVAVAAVRVLVRRRVEGAAAALLAYLPEADADAEEVILSGLPAVALVAGRPDPALVAALADPLPRRRAAAALTLGRLNGAAERDQARRALADPEPLVRLRAAQGLLSGREDAAVPVLVGLLDAPDLEIAWQAEELLHWLARGYGPAVVVGKGRADERRRCRDAWQAWWHDHGPPDWPALARDQRRPGLMLVSGASGVWLCGCDGRPRWRLSIPAADAHLLPGGRILMAQADAPVFSVRDLAGKVFWQRSFQGGEVPVACQSLPGGRTLLVMDDYLLEVTPQDRDVLCYRPDNNLDGIGDAVCLGEHRLAAVLKGEVVEIDRLSGAVLRRLSLGRGPFSDCRLASLSGGGYLVTDHNRNRLTRLDRAGLVVWQRTVPGINSATPLPGGVLVATDSLGGRLVEIDDAGAVVWEAFGPGEPFRIRPCLGLVRLGLDRPRAAAVNLDSVPYRVELLRHPDPLLRRRAVLALAQFGPKVGGPAVGGLLDALADVDEGVRRGAATALAQVGPVAVPAMARALRERPDPVRAGVASALGQMGAAAKEALPALTATLADDRASEAVRQECAASLGALGVEAAAAVPALLQMLHAGPSPLRASSAQALGRIGAVSPAVVPALIDALGGADVAVRTAAADALGRLGAAARDAVPALVEALQGGGQQELRCRAALALGAIGAEARAGVAPLVEILADPREPAPLRQHCAEALGRMKVAARSALPAFARLLAEPNLPADLARALTDALQRLGADGIPVLAEAARKGGNFRTRAQAIQTLNAIGPAAAAALPALHEVVKDFDPALSDLARRAIRAIQGGRRSRDSV